MPELGLSLVLVPASKQKLTRVSMTKPNTKLHIAMFPWLAFGHMLPFLELAKLIARKGHTISFISTPRNISRLPKLPFDLSDLINFVSLKLPRVDDNLPEDAEATSDLPEQQVPYLKIAFDVFPESLSKFLDSSSPDWIIYDFAHHWLPPLAEKFGISLGFFSIFNARIICETGTFLDMINGHYHRKVPTDFTVPPPWIPFETKSVYRLFEAKRAFQYLGPEANVSGVTDTFRLGSAIGGCHVMVVKTCEELESQWIHLLRQLHGKPVFPIGLLPPSVPTGIDLEDETWRTISGWLDKQSPKSVIYVAFGSEVSVSQEEIAGLANGLELSGLPFLWALRKPKDISNSESDSLLPDDYEERVKGQGLIWTSWAPQVRILSHRSIGGFLTHCGWSSVVEGLTFGVPLIMFPCSLDQPLVARVLADTEVGIEIPRDEEDGSFTSESVADSVRLVVAEEEGKVYRDKALEMSKVVKDKKLQEAYVDEFVQFLENHRAELNK